MNYKQILSKHRKLAEVFFNRYGLGLKGIQWYIPQIGQRMKKGLFVSFDVETGNPMFFGKEYSNSCRIRLLDMANDFVFGKKGFSGSFGDHQICADVNIILDEARPAKPLVINKSSSGFFDAVANKNISLLGLANQIKKGKIETGSSLDVYCRKYGIKKVLAYGRHFIGPDIACVEALEIILANAKIKSVLEIGGGAGVCGVAAERQGIEDFTFVDSDKKVCDYLAKIFSGSGFRAVKSNLTEFPLDRRWDLMLSSTPYELNPWFLEKRGKEIASKCETIIIQSGSPCFFEFEHDWIAGHSEIKKWPWYRPEQSLNFYYPYVLEGSFDWQYCLIGTHNLKIKKLFS